MYLLDTNILSAMIRLVGDPAVATWLRGKPVGILHTAEIRQVETLGGQALLPDGRRIEAPTNAAEAMFQEDIADRVLPLDRTCAAAYARVLATTRREGRTVPTIDLMIAATAHRHDASIVTRNTADFDPCGVPVINPWIG
jgi:predicted nucleic acid-binding protein